MSEEHNGDIKRFLLYLKETSYKDDDDIDYSILLENDGNQIENTYILDIKNAISKLKSYEIDGSYDFKSGYQAGLLFAVEILENILDRHEAGGI